MVIFNKYLIPILAISLIYITGCGDSKNKVASKTKKMNHNDTTKQHKKKVLYVDSYHRGYTWSDKITQAICRTFNAKLNPDDSVDNTNSIVTLRVTRMDTKRNSSIEFKKSAALKVKKLIESWKPDLVIASDDNASKFLIVPYYKDSTLPFVFCGVNGGAKKYGFPCSNVTGMIEVMLIEQIVSTLKKYAKGTRIGFIKSDTLTSLSEKDFIEKKLHCSLITRFVKDFESWKLQYQKLQQDVDILLVGNGSGIKGWDPKKAEKFVQSTTKIPTGNWDSWMASYVLVVFADVPSEQGEWAAQTALKILGGTPPSEIPITANKQARIILNMKLAKKLSIIFPFELVQNAELISAAKPKILFINSYHKGYKWSDNIEKGFNKALGIVFDSNGNIDNKSPYHVKYYRMNTKLHRSEEYKKKAALYARDLINSWKPDIVVFSDDNAAKYLVAPFFKHSAIPFVFCGINWSASEYGFPTRNITGILEVEPITDTIKLLKQFSKGGRIAYIGAENFTNRKNLDHYLDMGIKFSTGKFVETVSEWKYEYLRIQNDADLLLWFTPTGISGWDEKEILKFIEKHTKIPSGCTIDTQMKYTLCSYVNISEEQGWRVGKTAIKILNRTKPSDIPVQINRGTKLVINLKLAKRLGIKFPVELLNKATIINMDGIIED